MNTGQVIKQAISKNNKADRKNRKLNGTYRRSIISQSFVQPLRATLFYKHFQSRYFLIISAIVQSLFLFMLSRLEQACLVNGVD